jgi:hypothetical protein
MTLTPPPVTIIRHRVYHQRRAGAGRRLFDQVQWCGPIDHGAHEAEQQKCDGVGALGH